MTDGKTTTGSWGLVIIMLIIFWPVGLYLLYKIITTDKTAAFKNSSTLNIIGWVLVAIGIITGIQICVGDTFDFSTLIINLVFFVGGGAIMIIKAQKMKETGKRYKKYIDIVANQRITSIDTIAAAIPTSYETAALALQEMIDIGYFSGGYIDATNRVLVMPDRDGSFSESASKVIKCESCGANNTILAGHTVACEYCGSPLS